MLAFNTLLPSAVLVRLRGETKGLHELLEGTTQMPFLELLPLR